MPTGLLQGFNCFVNGLPPHSSPSTLDPRIAREKQFLIHPNPLKPWSSENVVPRKSFMISFARRTGFYSAENSI